MAVANKIILGCRGLTTHPPTRASANQPNTPGGAGHLGLTHTETQRGRLWTACGQRRVDSKNSQTTPAATSTTSIRQLLGATDAQTAHHATSSTAPAHQPLGSANAEMTPARAPARSGRQKAATRRNMRREERVTVQGPVEKQQTDGMSQRGEEFAKNNCPAEANCR